MSYNVDDAQPGSEVEMEWLNVDGAFSRLVPVREGWPRFPEPRAGDVEMRLERTAPRDEDGAAGRRGSRFLAQTEGGRQRQAAKTFQEVLDELLKVS